VVVIIETREVLPGAWTEDTVGAWTDDLLLARAIWSAVPYQAVWATALPCWAQSAPALALDSDPDSDRGA